MRHGSQVARKLTGRGSSVGGKPVRKSQPLQVSVRGRELRYRVWCGASERNENLESLKSLSYFPYKDVGMYMNLGKWCIFETWKSNFFFTFCPFWALESLEKRKESAFLSFNFELGYLCGGWKRKAVNTFCFQETIHLLIVTIIVPRKDLLAAVTFCFKKWFCTLIWMFLKKYLYSTSLDIKNYSDVQISFQI